MGLDLVTAGRDVPDDINVVIEIPKDFDRESKQDPQLDKAIEVLKETLQKK